MKIGIIGAGNMGTAILSGIQHQYQCTVCESSQQQIKRLSKLYRCKFADLESVLKNCSMIILAVKPQNFDELLNQIKKFPLKGKCFVSIAAGVTTKYIEKKLGNDPRIIRTMPNLPAQVGQSMTAVCSGKSAVKKDISAVRKLFDCIGKTVEVSENQMDAVTAVSGSGPAYVFLFIEQLMKAAMSLNLSRETSQQLILQTIHGSLALLESQSETPEVLCKRVTSKGGTTAAALEIFKKNKFEHMIKQALKAARQKSKDLSRRS